MAAPDHKIGQCIQRSALFPGRADGGTHGSERFAGSAKRRRGGRVGLGRGAVAPLHYGSVGYAPEKFSKINFKIACFLHFLQTEMVSSAASARQFRLGSNHTIPVIATYAYHGSRQIR